MQRPDLKTTPSPLVRLDRPARTGLDEVPMDEDYAGWLTATRRLERARRMLPLDHGQG